MSTMITIIALLICVIAVSELARRWPDLFGVIAIVAIAAIFVFPEARFGEISIPGVTLLLVVVGALTILEKH